MKQSTYNHQDSDKLSDLYFNMYSPEERLTTGEAPGMLPERMRVKGRGGSVDVAAGSPETEIAGDLGPIKREAAKPKQKVKGKTKKKKTTGKDVIDPSTGLVVGSDEWAASKNDPSNWSLTGGPMGESASDKDKSARRTKWLKGETGISKQELEARRKRRPQEDADREEHERKRAAGKLPWQQNIQKWSKDQS